MIFKCIHIYDISKLWPTNKQNEPYLQFGEVLATTEHDEAVIVAEIDYSLIEQRR